MTDKLSPEQQIAQDLLSAAVNQRNAAQNECVHLAAQLAAARRQIAELEGKLSEEAELPLSNGHAPSLEATH